MNIQGWFPLELTGLISLQSRGLSRVFSSTQPPLWSNCQTTALSIWTFIGKVMSLLFNMLSRFAIAFLSRSKWLLILWLQSPTTVIWELNKRKSVIASTFPSSICREVTGPDTMILVFLMLSFKPVFSPSSSVWNNHTLHRYRQSEGDPNFINIYIYTKIYTYMNLLYIWNTVNQLNININKYMNKQQKNRIL